MGFGFKGLKFRQIFHPRMDRPLRRKFGLTGKKMKKRLGFSRVGVGVSSAAGLSSSDSFYGKTGSIVGRY